ncbi:MAG TPA: DUF2254 family protein [Polyangia bacterium]|jgi:hypothetical protein|nr:DUF2254 family protein [Polyangia bacterium]
MRSEGRNSTRRRIWLYPILLLGSATAAVLVTLYMVDWFRWAPVSGGEKPGPLMFFGYDPDTAQNALGNLAQVIAAVLGIVITVVSIIVQLASTRYTPRVAEMFFKDRTNLLILGFFIVAGIDAVWVSLSVTRSFIPAVSITASLLLVTASILLMIPYFAYVFDFLDPEKLVARIEQQALASALGRDQIGRGNIVPRQTRVLYSVEQLGDVSMNSVAQKDKLIAQGAVDALKTLTVSYLPHKNGAEPGWFEVGPRLRQNPDFVSMSAESVDDLASQRVWLEWKVLRQYQAVFNEAIGQMPDMNYLVAINTRYIGEAALVADDRPMIRLVIKFFNTYLRATLNAENIRIAYNTLNQYRQFGEKVIARGHDTLAVEIAGYFRYYSQIAHLKGLSFVVETVTYDLATLCEHAHARRAPCHDPLLRVLLDLDRDAETAEQEKMLRGVRKAQAKLASYYLAAGDEPHARAIFEDMKGEPASRLASIRGELLAITAKDFWEVIDRGTNFDYMDETRKEHLKTFFSWFPTLQASPVALA